MKQHERVNQVKKNKENDWNSWQTIQRMSFLFSSFLFHANHAYKIHMHALMKYLLQEWPSKTKQE